MDTQPDNNISNLSWYSPPREIVLSIARKEPFTLIRQSGKNMSSAGENFSTAIKKTRRMTTHSTRRFGSISFMIECSFC
jgi:hypothetical protein